jgi:glycosyltransferase involved in cell wall biosynthesis
MVVAFYAPLKPPDHPVPSGDRRMAGAFVGLLESLGHEVELAARLRSHDRAGSRVRQERLRALGQRLAARLVAGYRLRPPPRRPSLWFTYHCYHKAPDWLGPVVARELAIPYVVAEASVAQRQAHGPWAVGHAATLEALAAADLVLAMTRKDLAGLASVVDVPGRLVLFPPFLEAAPFVAASAVRDEARARLAPVWRLDATRPWLLAVAMMRDDVKRLSYEILATALDRLGAQEWQLIVVGAGEALGLVEALFAGLGPDRVRFVGALAPEALPEVYAAADLLVWPACGEAYGMVLLEAQAAGTPVVAGAEGGVPDIVLPGETGLLVEPRRAEPFAAAIATLLADPDRRREVGRRAQARLLSRHDVVVARQRLDQALGRLGLEPVPCVSA